MTDQEQTDGEREQNEEQTVMRARLRLAAIVESSDDAIIAKDMNGIITDWNKGAERLYGYTAHEVIGKPISILLPPDRAAELVDIMRKIQAGETIKHFGTERQKKDGTRIDVSLTISPIVHPEGRIVGASAIARDISERKRAEKALRESEELVHMAALAGRMVAYEWDAATDEIVRSDGVAQILGKDAGTHTTGQQVWSMIPPEDREKLAAAVAQLSPETPFLQIRYRMVRSDGVVIWVDRTSRAYFDDKGRMLRIVGMLADVTDRVQAEEALADMSRKLLQAQEQERTRIGRELHDDINQRLALLSVEIQRIKEVSPITYGELWSRMDELGKRTSEISAVVQSLSHELHSSKLEYLGLISAMKGFCMEFGDKHKAGIKFDSEGIPPTVPQEISLCLFRVMQEGLQNALKHSGVRFFEVELSGSPTKIHLIVRDAGVGFNPELVRATKGLGLVSMQERVRLVKGTISITSRPQSGTEINVRIPLSAGVQTEQNKYAGA